MLYHRTIKGGLIFSTDVDIYEDSTFDTVQEAVDQILDKFALVESRNKECKVPTCVEIVFDIAPDNNIEYYIVDHITQHVLWLDSKTVGSMIHGDSDSMPHLSKSSLISYADPTN